MKQFVQALGIIGCIALTAPPAIAGKPERDKQSELEGSISRTITKIENECGCAVKITVDWNSYGTLERMNAILDVIGNIGQAAHSYCQSDTDKKAFCGNVEEFGVSFDLAPQASLSGKRIDVHSNLMSPTTMQRISDVLHRF